VKVIRKLIGNSLSIVELIEIDNKIYVRKTGDVSRNIERINSLKCLNLPLPDIITYNDKHYIMEYIEHLDMKTYLEKKDVLNLVKFIDKIIISLQTKIVLKDYSNVYYEKLSKINLQEYDLPFSKVQLIDRLPKKLPSSEYHGDLTLENILYQQNKDFMLIDPLTSEYDSYVFDLAKLRQDITCKWFIRNDNVYLDSKLKILVDSLSKYEHFNNDNILILMLLRVLPYTKNIIDRNFLTSEIKKLWK
jgi:hypothetical protein